MNWNDMANLKATDGPARPYLSVDSSKYQGSPESTVEDSLASLVGIDPSGIKWARELGQRWGQNQEYYGKGDAARHAALGWLASQSKSPRAAWLGIMARELEPVDLFTTKDTMADIRNNQAGYNLGASTRSDAESRIREMIQRRSLQFNPQGSAGAYK